MKQKLEEAAKQYQRFEIGDLPPEMQEAMVEAFETGYRESNKEWQEKIKGLVEKWEADIKESLYGPSGKNKTDEIISDLKALLKEELK